MPATSFGGASPEARIPTPSASILLLSPRNQVLLLHRVKTSSAFPSAHVFPGGNLSAFHEGAIPAPDSPERHSDGPAYRLAAIRETFEESGILLARERGAPGKLLEISEPLKEEGRKAVHSNRVRFDDWVRERGGQPDTGGLAPFTRWITPTDGPRRFTTQMYLYMLPTEAEEASLVGTERAVVRPTSDGGKEITSATFADAADWLSRAQQGDIILFPPQFYLLTLLSELFSEATKGGEPEANVFQRQRVALREFVNRPRRGQATATHPADLSRQVPWTEKVLSPKPVGFLDDGRVILALDAPGPELKDTGRGGDYDRVVVLEFENGIPRHLEVMKRPEAVARMRSKQGAKHFKM